MVFFTVREAAEQIGVCENTARTYIKQRRLMATRISPKVIRVSQAAIDEFLFNCTDRPASAGPDHHTDVFLVPSGYAAETVNAA